MVAWKGVYEMNDFTSIVKQRRSVNKFVPGLQIPREELDEIFSLVKFAPSAFNLQHPHYVVVDQPDVKERIYEAANRQYKIKTASAVILVLGDKKAYRHVERMNEGLLQLGVIHQQEFDQTVSTVKSFYETRGEVFQQEEAIRNASLSAMLFMLAAKHKRWDTCPMIGFDPDEVSRILNVPDDYVPTMLIAIGKDDESSQRVRGYRKPVGEFVSFNAF